MSKEKLSAYALYPVWFEQHGRELIVDCLYPFAEWYAAQVTERLDAESQELAEKYSAKYNECIELEDKNEQLQREMEEAVNLLLAAECPNCDGSGIIPVETTRVGYGPADEYGNPTPVPVQEREPTPCEWCATRDSFLTPKPEK